MSKYEQFIVKKLRDYPLASRDSKVHAKDFARPMRRNGFADFVNSLPDILAARELRELARRIQEAVGKKRALVWGFGGHVIKVGLAPILTDLMQRGFVTALATNGSGMIHDFEIALCGHTSEEVEGGLKAGRFGMARETGRDLNKAIRTGAEQGQGIGEAVGELLDQKAQHPDLSILVQAHRLGIPCTVHVAIGTDTIHVHPEASGEALGRGSQIDFRIFTQQLVNLDDGGVYLNLGSAVILPEVFLKALSLVRNADRPVADFTTVNFDFVQHYRPLQNVVRRPISGSGKGMALTGHHEIMIPLLAALLLHGS